MKKYMTIAALLAAGTAIANAEESTSLLSLDMVSSWNTIELTTPANGVLTSSNSGFVWDGSADLTESWQLSFTWTSKNTAALQLFGSNGQALGARGLVLEWSSNELKLTNRDDVTYATVSDVSIPSDGVSVTITYLASNDTANYASTVALTVGDTTVYGEAPSSDTTFLNNNSTTRLWTNGGKDQFANITLKSAVAVPEPSAFGLLAGLGALALVASRRRRK